MFSTIRTYNTETDTYDISYMWWDKNKIPHYADNCADLIFQLENEYKDLEKELEEV